MRVLWIDHVNRILGGAEVNLVELLQVPAGRQAWESTVACDPRGRLHGVLEAVGVERCAYGFGDSLGTLRLVGTRFPWLRAVRSLRALVQARREVRRLIAVSRPQVVVSCTNKDHFAAWPGCREAGIPQVWWCNDILSADFFPWMARRAFVSQARRGAARVVAVSEYARDCLRVAGLESRRTRVIHNGIPLERYQRGERGELRHMLNLPDDTLLFGVVGRYTPWKGQEFFLELARQWVAAGRAGDFVLMGHAFNEDQDYESRLRELGRQGALRNRVHFVSFQRQVVGALSDLDVLLHTSLKPEPFGRVIIEAMSVGLPVIAAREGGVPEIVRDGVDGYLATPGDAAAYLEAMGRLGTDSGRRLAMGMAARETVKERFSIERVRADFEKVFAACAS